MCSLYNNNIKKIQLATTVARKDYRHQVPLTLPTSAGSAGIKNYMIYMLELSVREREMGCRILDTQLWHQPIIIPLGDAVGL